MKTILRSITALLTVGSVVSFLALSSCDGDEPSMTKQEEVTALLVGKTWKIQSVNVGGVDKSSMFSGMTLQFTSNSVTASNGGIVWPSSNTWTFTSDEATTLRRSDGVDVQVEATETTLKLTLNWTKTTLGPGRVSSVAGTHVFTFGL